MAKTKRVRIDSVHSNAFQILWPKNVSLLDRNDYNIHFETLFGVSARFVIVNGIAIGIGIQDRKLTQYQSYLRREG